MWASGPALCSILPLMRICAAQSTGSANGWLRFKTAPISNFIHAEIRPGTCPSGRALRRGLAHIKGGAEVQKTESGEERRLGHPDTRALQPGGRERPQYHEGRVQNIHAADN